MYFCKTDFQWNTHHLSDKYLRGVKNRPAENSKAMLRKMKSLDEHQVTYVNIEQEV